MTTNVEQHLAAYTAQFGPKTEHERFLVQTMAHARWKLECLQDMEARLFELVMSDLATAAQTKAFAMYQRFSAAAERSYYKAYRELLAGRKANLKAETKALVAEMQAIANAPMPQFNEVGKSVAAPRRL